ncbi:MAG: class I SAM-dependent methyltransferase [Planctomycetota bacterium]
MSTTTPSDLPVEKDSRWQPVIDLMAGAKPVELGVMHSYHARKTPRRLLYTTSYYKFAAKLIASNTPPSRKGKARVLDVGCGEGIGTYLVAKECGFARGVDFDQDLIDTARRNWVERDPSPICEFAAKDFLLEPQADFDAVINFDVIEHIQPANAAGFIAGMAANLKPSGLAVVGTPNVTSAQHASAVTNAGHVNLYEAERLHNEMAERFSRVFMFGANDEIVHTGFAPMCHYLIAVGVGPIQP